MNGSLFSRSAMARVTFLSPDRIRIDGKDSGGSAFAIVSDGAITWVSWEVKNRGAFEPADSLENAIASMTGIANAAPTVIPSALLKLKWGFPFARSGGTSAVEKENIRGIDCYKVSVDQPEKKTTYWLDAKNYLLLQMKEEQDEQQTARMRKMMETHLAKTLQQEGIPLPKFNLTSLEIMHSFTIDGINIPVDPELFRIPTSK